MVTVAFKYNEEVKYKGQHAVVINNNTGSSYITLRLDDGTYVTVNRNDLFGMNEDIQERIDECDERIAKNFEKIKQFKLDWNEARDLSSLLSKQMNSILRAFHAINAGDIRDAKKQDEYFALREQRTDAILARNRATSGIISAAIDTGSECTNKLSLINQQSLLA